MLFYQNLDKIVFSRNQLLSCDELIIISGYVGPLPIRELQKLPIKSTVIYGMYGSDGIQQSLHNALVSADHSLSKVKVVYSTIPVHSKCYIWKYRGEVRSALVGSANFSTNGLTTPFKEVLADATADTFEPLDQYLRMVLAKSIDCEDAVVSENKHRKHLPNEDTAEAIFDKEVCSMPLFIYDNGEPVVPPQSGINWGLAKLTGSHVNINDAYIRIGTELIDHYPELFPVKQLCPSPDEDVVRADHRHNDSIEILWDDGTIMTGLLEGSIPREIDGKKELYPKQIASTPSKATLGTYLRKRLGVDEGYQITYDDLVRYGRTTIDVSLQGEGVYYFDFSTRSKPTQVIQTDRHHMPSVKSKSTTGFKSQQLQPLKVAEQPANYGNVTRTEMPKQAPVIVKIGDPVKHKAFGIGEVKTLKDGMITIKFAKEEKKFQYPKAFQDGFLQKI